MKDPDEIFNDKLDKILSDSDGKEGDEISYDSEGPREDDDNDDPDWLDMEEERASSELDKKLGISSSYSEPRQAKTWTLNGGDNNSQQQRPVSNPWANTYGGGNTQTSYTSNLWNRPATGNATNSWWGNSGNSYYQQQRPGYAEGGNPFTQPASNAYGNGGLRGDLDRTKKLVICADLYDILVESFYANGNIGMSPCGSYDIKPKFGVWQKIRALSPDFVSIIMNYGGDNQKTMQDNLMNVSSSLADFIRVPRSHVIALVSKGYDQRCEDTKPGTGLLQKTVTSIARQHKVKIQKPDILVIGSLSGLQGQSNRDVLMASNFNVDYVDVGQLNYFF